MIKDNFQKGDGIPDCQWFNTVAKVCNEIIRKEGLSVSEPEELVEFNPFDKARQSTCEVPSPDSRHFR